MAGWRKLCAQFYLCTDLRAVVAKRVHIVRKTHPTVFKIGSCFFELNNMITDFWFWYLSLSVPFTVLAFSFGTFAWCIQCIRMIVDSKERIIKIYLSLIKYFLFNHVHVLCVSVKTFVFYYMVIYLSISGILCKLYLQIFFDISKQILICIFSFKNIYTF